MKKRKKTGEEILLLLFYRLGFLFHNIYNIYLVNLTELTETNKVSARWESVVGKYASDFASGTSGMFLTFIYWTAIDEIQYFYLCISYSTWQCLEKELLDMGIFEIDVAVEWNY